MSHFVIRQASLKDMDFFLSMAKAEGWNPGINDARAFYETDPNGFFIGTLGSDKIGCISAVSYDKNFGFVGFYIVQKEFRGLGFGLKLWSHGIDYLQNRSIGLDGVLAQQKNYEKSGFKLYYKNQRFQGEALNLTTHNLIDLEEIPFEKLLEFDKPIFGVDRPIFLKHWIEMPNSYSLAKMEKEKMLGYGIIRRCYEGYKIGPLFANEASIAIELYQGLSTFVKKGPIFIDIPLINRQAKSRFEIFNLKPVFETVRMYTKEPPKQDLEKNFGVTTFELG